MADGMGSTGKHCDEITDAIDRVLADMDTGGTGGSLSGGGHVRPPEAHQRTEYGFTSEDAVRLRETAPLHDDGSRCWLTR